MSLTPPDQMLRVDLTDRTVAREPVPREWQRRFVGGKGLGARYLYEELSPGVDPLGPDNVLLFMLGPVSGLLPGEDRYAAVTKSPLTGCFLDSYAGGSFPSVLAGALPDVIGIAVTGRADHPVRLVVEDGTVEIEAADNWGADIPTVADAFPDAAAACIGPAGERTVAFATIGTDGGDHHAGRGGAGAVMGSKRLKAVVVRGEPPEGLEDLRERYAERFAGSDTGRWLRASGTVETADFANEAGILPTRGWQEGQFDGADGIGIAAIRELAREREEPDGVGPGGFRVETDDGDSVPRGATTMSLGAGLGIDDAVAVAELGERCDRLGLDLISAGSAVAWAIRASERGIVDRPLSFGDPDTARQLLDEIATRETDLGDALADGVEAATDALGGQGLIPTVKAMALPAYDPRGAQSMALAYATSDRGACHRRALPVEREVFEEWNVTETTEAIVSQQNQSAVLWSLVVDDFVGNAFDDLGGSWLDAVGLDTDGDMRTIGERIWTLTRLFNVREGMARDDDTLPVALREPLPDGPSEGEAVDPDRFESMLDEYYAVRGWGRDGRPSYRLVERLNLADTVDEHTPLAEEPATEPTDSSHD